MVKELIESNELKRMIAALCGKLRFEDVSEEEIEKIDSIYLTGKFLGKSTGIDLHYLKYLPNLNSLIVSDMEIDQEGMDLIFGLKGLKTLEIVRSEFKDSKFPEDINPDLNFRVLGCNLLSIDYPRIRKVKIGGSEVDFQRIDLDTAESLHITESRIKNVEDLEDKENIQFINFDGSELKDKNDIVVKDIKCHKTTSYSHADGRRVYDSEGER